MEIEVEYNTREVLSEAKKKLLSSGDINWESDAEFLLAHILNVPRSGIFTHNTILSSQYSKYLELIDRRITHEPMDSLIGFTEFLGLTIPFHKETLSPRQETEIMVDNIIRENTGRKGLKILDLCSGSGCIGLALSKLLNAKVLLADISPEALEISRQNARLNNLEVEYITSNLFDNIIGTFDIIVSNPPYIPTLDLNGLEMEVKNYDPSIALDGGSDGLDFYREIIKSAPKHLADGGLIYLEFGINQGGIIAGLMQGNFTDIEIVKDYSGIDRYIKARKNNAK